MNNFLTSLLLSTAGLLLAASGQVPPPASAAVQPTVAMPTVKPTPTAKMPNSVHPSPPKVAPIAQEVKADDRVEQLIARVDQLEKQAQQPIEPPAASVDFEKACPCVKETGHCDCAKVAAKAAADEHCVVCDQYAAAKRGNCSSGSCAQPRGFRGNVERRERAPVRRVGRLFGRIRGRR